MHHFLCFLGFLENKSCAIYNSLQMLIFQFGSLRLVFEFSLYGKSLQTHHFLYKLFLLLILFFVLTYKNEATPNVPRSLRYHQSFYHNILSSKYFLLYHNSTLCYFSIFPDILSPHFPVLLTAPE